MVIDIADNSRTHQLPGLHSLFNLPMNMNLSGGDVLEIEREIERLNRTQPWIDTSRLQSLADLKLAVQHIEFFNFDPPIELRPYTQNTWHVVPGGYRLSLPDSEWISIETNLLDAWDVQLSTVEGAKFLGRFESLVAAAQSADHFVRVNRPDALRIVERSAQWRSELPSDKQKEILARHRIPLPAGLTRGQASQMIAQLLSSKTSRTSR